MAKSTGPILAIGAVTMLHEIAIGFYTVDLRIPVATGLAAGAFALAEKVNQPITVGVAWVALVTVLFVPMKVSPTATAPRQTPIQTFAAIWRER